MSALTQISAPRSTVTGSRPSRLLVPAAVLVAAAILAFGLRAGVEYGQRAWIASHSPHVAASTPVPTSSQIEDSWGIRFTTVQLMGDNGLVELRYQVLDSTKANRLHADGTSLEVIPTIRVEGSGLVVTSKSLMFHIHNDWSQNLDGKIYSIIYGNPGGSIYPGGLVTIRMMDGLELQHVPVRG
jgi:hypothetical protein